MALKSFTEGSFSILKNQNLRRQLPAPPLLQQTRLRGADCTNYSNHYRAFVAHYRLPSMCHWCTMYLLRRLWPFE